MDEIDGDMKEIVLVLKLPVTAFPSSWPALPSG